MCNSTPPDKKINSSLIFLISSIKTEESIGFVKIFDFQFLMDLYILGCHEHDYFWKMPVCLCVYDKNFVASVAPELTHRIL